jgi:hypothetical protein
VFHRAGPGQPAENGPHPQRNSYSSFATFSDPDGNAWLLQEVTARLPGRVDTVTTYSSPAELAKALRAHRLPTVSTRSGSAGATRTGRTGTREYLVHEQSGEALPS